MPMAVLPWWNHEAAVAEVERAHDVGLRGIKTTSAPVTMVCPIWETTTGTRYGR